MKERFQELYDVLKLDRSKSAWTKQQTVETIYKELVDEVQEVKEALESNDIENLKEEMGDALWGLLLLFILFEEQELFTTKESIETAIAKLKRRKPNIFEGKELSPDEEMKIWKNAKKLEKEV